MNGTDAAANSRPTWAETLTQLGARVQTTLLSDRFKLSRRLKRLRQRTRGVTTLEALAGAQRREFERIKRRCEESVSLVNQRQAARPHLAFPPELPVSEHIDALKALITEHQVVIVSGETGSGKSTQLPKICLALDRGIHGRIGHTQPRRIAARAIAERIAEETRSQPGAIVGHCVRFDEQLAPAARVKVMTDGILLNEVHADPWLYQYDTIIIDEVHERSLNIDVLLGYLKRVLARRADLRLLITSATLDIDAFRRFYGNCAVYQIPGRSYPVCVIYRPLTEEEETTDLYSGIVDAIAELDQRDRGDVLVFLPGEREIREAHKVIARALSDDSEILDLYARLGSVKQSRIFKPGERRRIILSTNVAETSLTVPRVRHVIDAGLARISRYSPRRKLQQLPIEKIARANADQRLGRCGREQPGICVRLFSEADYLARREATEPEILRTNLAGVILRLKALRSEAIEDFPFAERPADRLLKDGYNVLQEIGALDDERELTGLGSRLNGLPVDPRLAAVVFASINLGCLREALIIVAALSIADPRERPHELREHADRSHQAFADKRSDFLWFVNAWPTVRELAGTHFKRRLRRCRKLFLSAVRVQEWVQLHDYLNKQLRALGHAPNEKPASYKSIHCALLAGFPSMVGEWQGDHYSGCRNMVFALHPASILHRAGVKWILAGDIVETGKPYARLGARIDPRWVDRVAGHLIRRSYEIPHFDARRGAARVTEIQRLFGLVLSSARVVPLQPIDAEAARRLFIEVGLVDAELDEVPEFLSHNRALIQRIVNLEARARRRDLVAPRQQLIQFYDDRIPASICTRRELLRWLREDPQHNSALHMDEVHATSDRLIDVPDFLFPDRLKVAGTDCELTYRFEPGAANDGLTLHLPLALLPAVRTHDLDRLVPGLLSEKIEALLRALPKQRRRQFSPAREFAMAAVEALHDLEGPLYDCLASCLSSMTGIPVDAELFSQAALEAHLLMRIEVHDDTGHVLASSRDLEVLRQSLRREAEMERDNLHEQYRQRSRGEWVFDVIPQRISQDYGGVRIHAIPALCDLDDAVELQVFEDVERACHSHRAGVARLLWLNAARELKRIERSHEDATQGALFSTLFRHSRSPLYEIAWNYANECVGRSAPVRDGQAFEQLQTRFRANLAAETNGRYQRLLVLFERGAQVRRWLDEHRGDIPSSAVLDIISQLETLLGPGSLTMLDEAEGAHAHRYIDALNRRLERLQSNPGKDGVKQQAVNDLWPQFLSLRAAAINDTVALAALHQAFEEWRVAIFAPELGAALKVTHDSLTESLGELSKDLRAAD